MVCQKSWKSPEILKKEEEEILGFFTHTLERDIRSISQSISCKKKKNREGPAYFTSEQPERKFQSWNDRV